MDIQQENVLYPSNAEALKILRLLCAVDRGVVDMLYGDVDLETYKTQILQRKKLEEEQTKITDFFQEETSLDVC